MGICFTYAIASSKRNYIYVGLSDNPKKRIKQHNNGKERTTRSFAPFRILLIEQHDTRAEARIRERYLKSGIGKEFLKTL